MQLKISNRLRPFSHKPSAHFLIPGTSFSAQFYPCLIKLFQFLPYQIKPQLFEEIELAIQGPVEQWTVCQDLLRKKIFIWGQAKEGWFHFSLSSQLVIHVLKAPDDGFIFNQGMQTLVLKSGDSFSILNSLPSFSYSNSLSCLSLGINRLQDWCRIKKTGDLAEIFPFWHYLGQLTPTLDTPRSFETGILSLLKECEDNQLNGKPEEGYKKWKNLFQAGFDNFLVPRLMDTDYQGLIKSTIQESVSPLVLLTKGSVNINHLFIRMQSQTLHILPHLLPQFHSGRLLNVHLNDIGVISIEWTKKTIRRMIFHSFADQLLPICIHSKVHSVRLRERLPSKGQRISCFDEISFKKNSDYFFDNFE